MHDQGGRALRIASKVFLVGGIPIVIAAVIATASWFLLREADRARSGAVIAGVVYRDLLLASAERDRFPTDPAAERGRTAARFFQLTTFAAQNLASLADNTRNPAQADAVASAGRNLKNYDAQMRRLVQSTERNDRLTREMSERATGLVLLTDQARTRQHASNADIVGSVSEKDQRLRSIREIVDQAQNLRAVIATSQFKINIIGATEGPQVSFAEGLVRNAARDLERSLQAAGRNADARSLEQLLAAWDATRAAGASVGDPLGSTADLVDWCERLLKVDGSAERSLHEEVGQLLTYSIEANETEQATQNIAIAALKLGQRTSNALDSRNVVEARAALEESEELGATMARLPISPLIQTEMIESLDQWRNRLATTLEGLEEQNAAIAGMNEAAMSLTGVARELNDTFTGDADRLGTTTRMILLIGATIGLFFGSYAAIVVARSIVQPLQRVQQSMLRLAEDPAGGGVSDAHRTDELGDMARAANFFVDEIVAREGALREAVQRADSALADLQRTQAELIQAEKLASLGQLVAGVAHEINTPVGVALTTATVMEQEAKAFSTTAGSQPLLRSQLMGFIERMSEGTHLLAMNLSRAANLVHSFKQVAADQVSGERRAIALRAWLDELVLSLSPILRKRGLAVEIDCPEGVMAETYPGALGQVLTNLVVNAATHAFEEGQGGTLKIAASEIGADRIRLVVSDDGRGVPAENLPRIFDPFFTTARQKGSTGLGLHIVYNLVSQTLRGRIEASSGARAGTSFTIEIPRIAPMPEGQQAAAARPAGKPGVRAKEGAPS